MALMHAAINGKLDCLEHLIAKGANLEATNYVMPPRQLPPALSIPRRPLPLLLRHHRRR